MTGRFSPNWLFFQLTSRSSYSFVRYNQFTLVSKISSPIHADELPNKFTEYLANLVERSLNYAHFGCVPFWSCAWTNFIYPKSLTHLNATTDGRNVAFIRLHWLPAGRWGRWLNEGGHKKPSGVWRDMLIEQRDSWDKKKGESMEGYRLTKSQLSPNLCGPQMADQMKRDSYRLRAF